MTSYDKPWTEDLLKAQKHIQKAIDKMYEEADKKGLDIMNVDASVYLIPSQTIAMKFPKYHAGEVVLKASVTL